MDVNLQTSVNQASINEIIEPAPQATSAKKTVPVKDKLLAGLPIGSVISLFVLLVLFIGQTFAYFTYSNENNSNKIISGNIGMSLINVSDDGGNFDWSAEPIEIMPASVYTYGGVGVKNDGTLPVYVRIKVEKTIIQSEYEISPGWERLIACNFMANNETLPEEQQDLWIYHEGYYYYKVALAPGEQTTSLFDKVLFAPEMGNEFKNSSIQFKLVCQAVQSGGNSPDPTDAWGWPGESSLSE